MPQITTYESSDSNIYEMIHAHVTVYEVELDTNEHITDETLSEIPTNIDVLKIIRKHEIGGTRPCRCSIKVLCSAKKLGEINPKVIEFAWHVENLESDSIFSECNRLEVLYIGAYGYQWGESKIEGTKDDLLFSTINYLGSIPTLKNIKLQGYGTCDIAPTFKEFIDTNRHINNVFYY